MSDDEEDYMPESEAAATDAAGEANEEVAALKAEIAELKDRLLRALAEAENTRRRAEREKQDASQYAVANFARDMLGVADNFARAIAGLPGRCARRPPTRRSRRVIDGVEATDRQLHGDARTPRHQDRSTPRTRNSTPICIRPSPKCRATASRRAPSWMWCRPAT